MTTPISVAIVGATGTIGHNALAVMEQSSAHVPWLLAARCDVDTMSTLCRRYRPAHAVMIDADAAATLTERLGEQHTQIHAGEQALCDLLRDGDCDSVIAAAVGIAGLPSVWAAVDAGKQVLLANKEAMVVAGRLLTARAAASGARIVPVDSEHNGVYQCLPRFRVGTDSVADYHVQRISLTASGGPLLTTPITALAAVTPEQACAHPNWTMGAKISVDSATMMNKGLELIEARHLFACAPDRLSVIVHPQSIVHALVQFVDGNTLACLSPPDMRRPLAHALGVTQSEQGSDRICLQQTLAGLDLAATATLTFAEPDRQRFRCLALAEQAMAAGDAAEITLNAANEVAVQAFLQRRLRFTDIAAVIEAALALPLPQSPTSMAEVLAVDATIRRRVLQLPMMGTNILFE